MIGIPTVLITLDPEQTGLMRPPRAIHPKGFRFGHSVGLPFEKELQTDVVKTALQQLVTPQEPGRIHFVDFPAYRDALVAR